MAVVTISNVANASDRYFPDLFEFDFSDPNLVVQSSITSTQSTKTVQRDVGVVTITATGTDFTFRSPANGGAEQPLSGQVTNLTLAVNGAVWMTITGLSIDLVDLDQFMMGWTRNGVYRPGNGFDLFSLLLGRNDTINGSDFDDDLIGGRNSGNDLIYAGAGSDYITADGGNDTVFGGAGTDTYSLTETFFDTSAYRGAVVNLAAGIASDSWGGTDQFSSIERVQGSRLADRFIGSGADEVFFGFRGNDTIDGGLGDDAVRYDRDANWGGMAGVTVNLTTGIAIDGWGNTDRLFRIEWVDGTAFNDVITGNAARNVFGGGAGQDRFDGAGGQDVVDFYDDGSTSGAVVNLGLATNQVVNDGFGRVETLTSIEGLWGTFLADRFTGNLFANEFYGDRGNDTLSGMGGNDTIDGGGGVDLLTGGVGNDRFEFSTWDGANPFGDTITDFVSGVDRLVFHTEGFVDMDTVVRFQNGTSAGGAGQSWFFFNTTSRQLFWDHDGTGGDAAVFVASLTGVNSLTASDFLLF